MKKLSFLYDQSSVRLLIEGLPDLSLGQEKGHIGIITTWRLEIIGSPDLEGKKEHLQALISAMLPYARYRLSGIAQPFTDKASNISIFPRDNKHELLLQSSQKGVAPLRIILDDAELADIVRCLDDLMLDNRVSINWKEPPTQPLSRNELVNNTPILNRMIGVSLGSTLFIFTSILLLLIPVPDKTEEFPIESTKNHLNNT